VTPYDWLLVRRTAALGLLFGLLALAVMIATDETSNTLAGRLGRLAAVAPLVGASATFLASRQLRARGEGRALESMGATPMRVARGILIGGMAIAAVGPILAVFPHVDLSTLFPAVGPVTNPWSLHGGAWHDASRGLVVQASGDLAWSGSSGAVAAAVRPLPRMATALSLALAAAGCPLWIAIEANAARRGLVAAAVVASAILAFHMVAAGRISALALTLPPLALVVDGALLLRSRTWC
jgi:hypothetical protein